MRDLLSLATGKRLDLAEYDVDFYATVEAVDGPILKTERIQTFREPGSPSCEAYAEGRWREALRIAAEPNPELVRFFRQLEERGSGLRRLRIVEPPLTPYLIWELHFLRYRADAGEQIRVLDASLVGEMEEERGTVPELMVIGVRGQVRRKRYPRRSGQVRRPGGSRRLPSAGHGAAGQGRAVRLVLRSRGRRDPAASIRRSVAARRDLTW
ncbi:hypothetical protein GVV04_11775 [Micromonospora sp. NEAU-HG-1]|nr:DUF6879 family protein [Micromonospora rubida]NBE81654.1 hypothetical protein [Micromonospora rubida]